MEGRRILAFVLLLQMAVAAPTPWKREAGSNAFRMVGNLEDWKSAMPSTEVAKHYTHINFFVLSTGSVAANTCSPTCTLSSDSPQTSKVTFFHSLGVKVLASFGGANMGQDPNSTTCWNACLDQTDSLAAQLAAVG